MTLYRRFTTLLLTVMISAAASVSVAAQQTSTSTFSQYDQPGVYRLSVGDVQITALSDGTVPQDLHAILTGTDAEQTDSLLSRSFIRNPLEVSINAFLIETGSRLILVDTGAGKLFGPGLGGKLLTSLRAAGYGPEQIDDILITHVHADHSGGLTDGNRLVFPNATVHVHRADVEFFLTPSNASRTGYAAHHFDEAERTVRPYQQAGTLATFSGAGEVLPGITAIPTPGHTPGHTFYRLESRGEQIEFWGDIMHFGPIQFPEPSITVAYDLDSSAAASQRTAQFERAVRERRLVAVAHLPFPGIGHVRDEAEGYSWVPVEYRDRSGQ